MERLRWARYILETTKNTVTINDGWYGLFGPAYGRPSCDDILEIVYFYYHDPTDTKDTITVLHWTGYVLGSYTVGGGYVPETEGPR